MNRLTSLGIVLYALTIRTLTFYAASRLLTYGKDNLLMKAAGLGFLGGILAFAVAFFPLGGLLVFAMDYYLVKDVFDLRGIQSFAIVVVAGGLGTLPMIILESILA